MEPQWYSLYSYQAVWHRNYHCHSIRPCELPKLVNLYVQTELTDYHSSTPMPP